jgi:DNA anti-recombination protein RmuC
MSNIDEKIEILIDQVGRMTEGITESRLEIIEMRTSMAEGFAETRTSMAEGFAEMRTEMKAGFAEMRTEMKAGFAEMRASTAEGFARLIAVSERQERNIDRLVGIVETLIQRQSEP